MVMVVASGLPLSNVHAQTASQIVPPSFRPQPAPEPHNIGISGGAGVASPEGSESLSVSLASVRVDGGFDDMAPTTDALLAQLNGRNITVAELFDIARGLEKAYFAAGYGLVRVAVPPQSLQDGGVARIAVVDGFIERVDVQSLPKGVRQRIGALLQPLVGQHHLKFGELQRRLLLAGQVPGVVLRSTLLAGENLGGSQLVIEARHVRLSGQVSMDNRLSSALGRSATIFNLSENSLGGHGEQLYISLSGDPGASNDGFTSTHPRNRALAAGAVTPLGVDGLSAAFELSESITTPRVQTNGFQIQSIFDRYCASLTYPVLLARDRTVTLGAAFDLTNEWLSAHAPLGAPISIDHLRIVRLSADGYWLTPWRASINGHGAVGFGLDVLGARTRSEATSAIPLSRQGSDARFSKLDLSLAYSQPLASHLVFDGAARGQTGFGRALASSEQIGIVSATGLSGFDSGSLEGDEGYALRGAVSSPWANAVGAYGYLIAPYAFIAHGEIGLERPTAQEHARVTGDSYGVGLRLGAAPNANSRSASLSVELSRSQRSDQPGAQDRVTLSGAVTF